MVHPLSPFEKSLFAYTKGVASSTSKIPSLSSSKSQALPTPSPSKSENKVDDGLQESHSADRTEESVLLASA